MSEATIRDIHRTIRITKEKLTEAREVLERMDDCLERLPIESDNWVVADEEAAKLLELKEELLAGIHRAYFLVEKWGEEGGRG